MRQKSQHMAAFVLGAAVALPLLIMLLLQGWQLYLKNHARHRLRDEAVHTITLPEQQVHWEKKEKEIVVNGRLFDIRSYHVQNGILTAIGVWDDEETSLLEFIQHHTRPEKAAASLIQWLLLSQCFIAFVSWLLTGRLRAGLQKFFPALFLHYCNPFTAIVSPPPRWHQFHA